MHLYYLHFRALKYPKWLEADNWVINYPDWNFIIRSTIPQRLEITKLTVTESVPHCVSPQYLKCLEPDQWITKKSVGNAWDETDPSSICSEFQRYIRKYRLQYFNYIILYFSTKQRLVESTSTYWLPVYHFAILTLEWVRFLWVLITFDKYITVDMDGSTYPCFINSPNTFNLTSSHTNN